MDEEQKPSIPRQLRIKGMEGKQDKAEKVTKEKEKPGNKWIVVAILVVSFVVSMIFKVTSGELSFGNQQKEEPVVETVPVMGVPGEDGVMVEQPVPVPQTNEVREERSGFRLFGPVEYRYSR